MFQEEEYEEADQFMASKPWLGALKAPTKPVQGDKSKPKAKLELDYVHGYRAKDCRNNLRYLKNGKIVYHAAAIGIVHDIGLKRNRKQNNT